MYKLNSATKVGQSRKLDKLCKESYVFFRLKDRKSEKVIHHDRIKIYMDRDIPIWLRRMRSRQHREKATPYENVGDRPQNTTSRLSNNSKELKRYRLEGPPTRSSRTKKTPRRFDDCA